MGDIIEHKHLNILITKDANTMSDYDIEEKYKEFLIDGNIEISNILFLERVKVGLYQGDFKTLTVEVIDIDGKRYKDSNVKKIHALSNIYSSVIVCYQDDYLDSMIDWGGAKK